MKLLVLRPKSSRGVEGDGGGDGDGHAGKFRVYNDLAVTMTMTKISVRFSLILSSLIDLLIGLIGVGV